MKKWLKIIGLLIVVALIGFGAFIWWWQRPMLSFDDSKIPFGMVTDSPLEFDKVYSISKFRSGAGHDYTVLAWDGESCRSMKHYFNIDRGNPENPRIRSLPTVNEPNIKIFAPFDGAIDFGTHADSQIPKGSLDGEVDIRSRNFPNFRTRLMHVNILPTLHFGSEVKSGQQVGTIGPKDGMDVTIEGSILFKGGIMKLIYLSAFELMNDQAFSPYANAGYKRSDFIISREYRDAHPLKCGVGDKSQEFIYDVNYDRHSDSDFVDLKVDPFEHK